MALAVWCVFLPAANSPTCPQCDSGLILPPLWTASCWARVLGGQFPAFSTETCCVPPLAIKVPLGVPLAALKSPLPSIQSTGDRSRHSFLFVDAVWGSPGFLAPHLCL